MEEEEGLGWVRFVLFVPSVWVGGAIGVISLRFALYNLKKKGSFWCWGLSLVMFRRDREKGLSDLW